MRWISGGVRPTPRRAAIGGLLTGCGNRGTSGPGGDLRYRIVEDVLDLVDADCVRGPVAVVLEDLHWADELTLLAIRAMARDLADTPLLLVCSLRPSPHSAALDRLIEDVLGSGGCRMRPEPLSPLGPSTGSRGCSSAGCLVRESRSIGAWALVGMGAVVTRDVPTAQVWAGVPARLRSTVEVPPDILAE